MIERALTRISRLAALTALAAVASSSSVGCALSDATDARDAGTAKSDARSNSGPGSRADGSVSDGSVSDGSGGAVSDSGRVSDGNGGSDGGGVWSPTAAAPIHYHWMIGSFSTADILSNQEGQVVYDIDGQGATVATVAAIHAAGAIAICYVDVGTLEQGRPDYNKFPSSVKGAAVQGWPGENWLLVTAANQSILLPLMKARFKDWCQAKGFDGIEPDNLDGWTNISSITETDNLTYDLAIASLAHALPLSIGLKNLMTDLDSSQFPTFLAAFDWALNEQCYEYGECSAYTQSGSFIPAGKAVWDVEYNASPNCAQADQAHLNAQWTDLDLVGDTASGYEYTPCIPDSQTAW